MNTKNTIAKNEVDKAFITEHSGYGGSLDLLVGDLFTRQNGSFVKVEPQDAESILPGVDVRGGGVHMRNRPIPHNGLYLVQEILPDNVEYSQTIKSDGTLIPTPPRWMMKYICLR